MTDKPTAAVAGGTSIDEAAKANFPTSSEIAAKIEGWRKSLANNKKLAMEVAMLALAHCYRERTAEQLRSLLKVIETEGKDYVRRAPFAAWLIAFAPVKMVKKDEGDVLEFDKDSALLAVADDIDGIIAAASEKPWWTMTKDKEADPFSMVKFEGQLIGLTKKAITAHNALPAEDQSDRNVNHLNSLLRQFENSLEVEKAA